MPTTDYETTGPQGTPEGLSGPSPEKIRKIVERETHQRKRYLRFYMALLVIPFGLGIAAFMFGRSASEIKTAEVAPLVAMQLKEPLGRLSEIDRRTAELTNESEEQSKKIVELDNEQGDLHEQVSSLGSSQMPFSPALTKEVERMLPSLREVDRKATQFAVRLADQEEQSKKFSRAQAAIQKDLIEIKDWPLPPYSPLTLHDYSPLTFHDYSPLTFHEQLAALKSDFDKNAVTLKAMAKRVADMEEQREADRLQIASLVAVINLSGFPPRSVSYAIKESSEAEIYDLGLKIKLGTQSAGKIDWIELSFADSRLINNLRVLKLTNLEMGQPTAFRDGRYTYVLTPIYIQRRKLMKDFIGIGIHRHQSPQAP